MKRFAAVTFDVTGTLLQFRQHPGEFYAKVGGLFGVDVDPQIVVKHLKTELHRMNVEHPNFGLHTGIGWENWWRQIVEQTFKKSTNVEHSEMTSIYDQLMSSYQTSECWAEFKGARELLETLNKLEIPVGIISNNDVRLNTILKVMDMRKYFKFVLISYEAGFTKPDRRIFEMAFRLFNVRDLKPDNVLHVGDKMELDYIGAENVGWKGALVHVIDKKKIMSEYPQANINRLFNTLQDLQTYITK